MAIMFKGLLRFLMIIVIANKNKAGGCKIKKPCLTATLHN